MESVTRAGSTWADWDDPGLRLFYGASGLAERERLPYLLWTLGAEGALRFWHCRLGAGGVAFAGGRGSACACEWFESMQRLVLAGVLLCPPLSSSRFASALAANRE